MSLAPALLALLQAPVTFGSKSAWPLDELRVAQQQADPLTAARATAELLQRGREFSGARAAAQAGLAIAPADLQLLQLATSSSLWAQDTARARADLDRWSAALAEAGPALEQRVWWNARLAESRSLLDALETTDAQVERSAARARSVALALLAACAALGVWLVLAQRAAARRVRLDA